MGPLPPPLRGVLDKLKEVRESGDGQFAALCPAHADSTPSLSIAWGEGKVVLHCQAGCEFSDVLSALSLKPSDLTAATKRIVATYDYRDEDERLVFQVVRQEPKNFFQRRPDPDHPGNWINKLDGVSPVLYNLPEVAEAIDSDEDVWIVEGEKDADNLRSQCRVIATCNHSGAGKWTDAHSARFKDSGSRVRIVTDEDKAGYRHALKVHESLLRVAGIDAELLRPVEGKDVSAHLESKTLDQLLLSSREDLEALAEGPSGRSTALAPDLEDGPLAEYVAAQLAPDYVKAAGLGWLRNNGTFWEEVTDDSVVEATRLVLKRLAVGEIGDVPMNARQVKELSILFRSGKIRAVSGLLRGMLEVSAADFDTADDYLNTPSGIVDLRTRELLPHGPAFKFTKITGASFVPDAKSADWDKALRALPDDVRSFMQLRLGQALTGHPTQDDKLVILKGGGENGKSTVLDAIQKAVGSFAGVVPDRLLLANPGDHPTELTTLRGLRMAFLEELPEGARFSIKRLKDVVGTATITARKIAKDNITWVATHSLFITTNYTPKINETDHGTWRRLLMVKFPFTFRPPGDRRQGKTDKRGDPALRERLRREPNPAVLAWLVEGAALWYAADKMLPREPAAVRRDTEEWRKETDLVLAFTADTFEFRPDSVVLASEVHDAFSAWLRQHGHPEWSTQTFASRFGEHEAIQEHHVHKARKRINSADVSRPRRPGPRLLEGPPTTGNLHVWTGLHWRDSAEEPEEPDE